MAFWEGTFLSMYSEGFHKECVEFSAQLATPVAQQLPPQIGPNGDRRQVGFRRIRKRIHGKRVGRLEDPIAIQDSTSRWFHALEVGRQLVLVHRVHVVNNQGSSACVVFPDGQVEHVWFHARVVVEAVTYSVLEPRLTRPWPDPSIRIRLVRDAKPTALTIEDWQFHRQGLLY